MKVNTYRFWAYRPRLHRYGGDYRGSDAYTRLHHSYLSEPPSFCIYFISIFFVFIPACLSTISAHVHVRNISDDISKINTYYRNDDMMMTIMTLWTLIERYTICCTCVV